MPARRALCGAGRGVLVALLAGVLAVLPACADERPRLTAPGTAAAGLDLTGQTVVVGSKEFDEQLLLCTMTIALLQSTGADVVDQCDTVGSENTRAALAAGRIDLYWEYTGTAWRTYLRQESRLADPAELYAAVRDADVPNGIRWLAPAPFDNTYAIGVQAANAGRLGARTISDLATLARDGSPDATLCIDQEFTGREDGLVDLLRTYGFEVPAGQLVTVGLEDIYPAVAAGRPCVFGEVFATDGRLNALGIVTLADDRDYFLPYQAAITVRDETLERVPQLAVLAERIAPELTEAVMRELNEQVSVAGRSPDDVARTFLRDRGLIGR